MPYDQYEHHYQARKSDIGPLQSMFLQDTDSTPYQESPPKGVSWNGNNLDFTI